MQVYGKEVAMSEEKRIHAVQLNFSDEAFKRFEKLMEKTDLTNLGVMREALGLFEYVVDLVAAGGELIARQGEHEEEIILRFIYEKDDEVTELDRKFLREFGIDPE